MDAALILKLAEQAYARATEVQSIGHTRPDSPATFDSPEKMQNRLMWAFAELVAEECAKLCDYHAGGLPEECAYRIRERFVNSPQPDPNQRQPGEG